MNEMHLINLKGTHQPSGRIKGVEPVIHLSRLGVLDPRQLVTMIRTFPRVHVAAPFACPDVLRHKVNWYHYGPNETTVEVWNHVLMHCGSEKTLFLQDDEKVDLADLASVISQCPEQWIPALVRWSENGIVRQCYQLRVIPSDAEMPFNGVDLPDASRCFMEMSGTLAGKPLLFDRATDPFRLLQTEKELSASNPPALLYLVTGIRYFDAGKYVHAAAQFRRVMKDRKALSFESVAAINGLASCMAEQYKCSKTVELAEESVRIEPLQQLAYLILFRMHQLEKRWSQAYEMLEKCHGIRMQHSRASFDKGLSDKEMLSLMADMAFRAGMRTESMRHYQSLHELLNDRTPAELTERLLMLALEEQEYDLSVRYFCKLFGDPAKGALSKSSETAAFDYLGLFIKNGWYEFASACCERMMKKHPENEVYMRRWIAILSKSRDIEKARSLVSGIRKSRRSKTATG